MAVGKGSMERASKAVAAPKAEAPKTVEAPKAETTKAAAKPEAKKAAPKKTTAKKPAAVKDTAVIAATSKQVMDKIVYQSSSQLLERDAKPNESFYVGDDMPIYFY